MTEKLTWDEIKQRYDGEWVQLIEHEWDKTEPDPQSGVVRVHSKDAKEFHRLVKQDPVKRSAILFVGELFNLGENVIFNANQHQWFSTK